MTVADGDQAVIPVADGDAAVGVETYREGAPAPSRPMEVALAAAALVFMVVLLVMATQIDLRREPGPGQIGARFWPTMLAGTGVAIAVWRLVLALRGPAPEREELEQVQVGGPGRLAFTVVLSVVYVALWELREVVVAGYQFRVWPPITVGLIVALTWVSGGRGWRALIMFPVLLTGFIYVLFDYLLRIPL